MVRNHRLSQRSLLLHLIGGFANLGLVRAAGCLPGDARGWPRSAMEKDSIFRLIRTFGMNFRCHKFLLALELFAHSSRRMLSRAPG